MPNKKVTREKLDIGIGKRVVLSIGRMDRIKDFQTLIQAFVNVARNVPESILLIAGGGDGNYMEELQFTARQTGIGDQVKFLGSRRDVADLIAACDVFALTSISDKLAESILFVLDYPGEARERSRLARELVENQFSAKRMAETYLALYFGMSDKRMHRDA